MVKEIRMGDFFVIKNIKPNFEEARQHWDAFWAGEIIDRPCILVRAHRDGTPERPYPSYMEGHDGNFTPTIEKLDAWMETIYWGADAMPTYSPSFGPDMFAAFLGAPLGYKQKDQSFTSWAEPCIEDWNAAFPLKLQEENPVWQRIQAFVKNLAQVARGRWIVGHLDMHSNMDALSALRNPERLCMDLFDEPELIERAMRDVRAVYPQVDATIRELGRMAQTGSSGWIQMYSEKKFNVIQCDFCCMVSPPMFRKFILPALEEETVYLDHSIYHLDGVGALKHLDDLLALPKLNAIQWVPGAGQKPLREWIDVLKKIIDAGKSVQIYCSIDEIEHFHHELGPRRVFYDCWGKSEAEARGIIRWLEQNT